MGKEQPELRRSTLLDKLEECSQLVCSHLRQRFTELADLMMPNPDEVHYRQVHRFSCSVQNCRTTIVICAFRSSTHFGQWFPPAYDNEIMRDLGSMDDVECRLWLAQTGVLIEDKHVEQPTDVIDHKSVYLSRLSWLLLRH